MKQKTVNVRRFALDARLVAMFLVVAISRLTGRVGAFKFTFTCLPTILCAFAFGPVDAMIVGTLGAFLEQLLTYGITPTTALWVLPATVRGLIVGMAMLALRKVSEKKRNVLFLASCTISGVVVSLLNTFALYVDSTMFGYYTDYLIYGALTVRILSGIIVSTVVGLVTIPLVKALKKARDI